MKLKQALKKLEDLYGFADSAMADADAGEADVCAAIRSERRKKGMSLRELAKEVGVSPAYMSDVENYNRYPSSKTLEKIIKALNI